MCHLKPRALCVNTLSLRVYAREWANAAFSQIEIVIHFP